MRRLLHRRPGTLGLRGDLSHALRQIRRAPAFAAIFAATIGLGPGASLTIFMLIDHVFVQPLDVRDASRLVVLQRMTQTGTIGQAWLRVSREYRPGVLSRPQSLGMRAIVGYAARGISVMKAPAVCSPTAWTSARFS